MSENFSGKWYKNPVIIAAFVSIIGAVLAAVITGIFGLLTAVLSKNPVLPKPNPTPTQEYPTEKISASVQTFQDDFENGLKDWIVKRYYGYNNFMRWHISDKEQFSGKSSLTVGHEDTDKKDNNDTVHIETKKCLLLSRNATLSFKIKKEHRINLEIVLRKEKSESEGMVAKFYPGNRMYGEWRVENIPLEPYIDNGLYKIVFRAWDKGSLYLDDIEIQHYGGVL